MKKLNSAAVAALTASAVILGAGSASAAPVGAAAPHAAVAASPVTTAAPAYAATSAFRAAAKDINRTDGAKPAAVPAVVATAFVAGAAYGAGKVVAGWAAKKVIGRWNQPALLQATALD